MGFCCFLKTGSRKTDGSAKHHIEHHYHCSATQNTCKYEEHNKLQRNTKSKYLIKREYSKVVQNHCNLFNIKLFSKLHLWQMKAFQKTVIHDETAFMN